MNMNTTEQKQLVEAIEQKNIPTIESLLNGGLHPEFIDYSDPWHKTPLHIAAEKGSIDIMMLLVKNGANLHTKDRGGWTVAHWGARGGNIDILNYVKENGVSLDTRDKYGNTPAHIAALEGQVQIMEYLHSLNIPLDVHNDDGQTPLHRACYWGRTKAVLYLLQIGCSPDTIDKYGGTPIQLLQRRITEPVPYDRPRYKQCLNEVEAFLKSRKQTDKPDQSNLSIEDVDTNDDKFKIKGMSMELDKMKSAKDQSNPSTENVDTNDDKFKIHALEEKIESLKIELSKKDQEITMYDKRIKGMSMELDMIKSAKDQTKLSTDVDNNDDKFKILKEEIESLKLESSKKDQEIIIYDEQIKGMTMMEHDKMKSAKDQLNVSTDDVDTNDDKFKILKEENESLKIELSKKDRENAQLKSNNEPSNVKDQSVQFDYMIPVNDCLDHVHVAADSVYLIQGSNAQSFNWTKWGLKMHFSENTLSSNETCEVAVKALVGGKFQFPNGCELMSAVYAVSFARKIKKPVKLEMQHCAVLKDDDQLQYLSFVKAPMKKTTPPFEFDILNGGEFSADSQYGSIVLDHFCLISIVFILVKSSDVENGATNIAVNTAEQNMSYTGQLYYTHGETVNNWIVRFMAVKNLSALESYLSVKYPNSVADQSVCFEFNTDSSGVLELVMDEPQSKSNTGWTVLPHAIPLTLKKSQMDMFGYSNGLPNPPTCLMTVFATVDHNTSPYISYGIPVRGVVSDTEKIVINKLLETSSVTNSSHATVVTNAAVSSSSSSHDQLLGTSETENVAIDKIVSCITDVFDKLYSKLKGLFENDLEDITGQMLSAGIITRHIASNSSFNAIMKQFQSGFAFHEDFDEVKDHLLKFIEAMSAVGGPFTNAIQMIKRKVRESLKKNLNIDFKF